MFHLLLPAPALKGSGETFGDGVPLSIDIGAARHGQFIALAVFEGIADRFAAGAAVGAGTGAVYFLVSKQIFFIQRQFHLCFCRSHWAAHSGRVSLCT